MLAWVLLVQLHGWFSSMHTHHAWVLLEKDLSLDFWVIGKPGLLHNFTVKSNHNNGGSGPNARLCARDGKEEEGEDGANFLYCHFITVGDSQKSLTVLS